MIGFLYGQTEYAILENSLFLKDYITFAKKEGYSFLTITDPNMYGFYKFYHLCIENNIKPVIGLKVNVESKLEEAILLYAKNEAGYQNLMKLSSKQMISNKSLTFDDLKEHANGLIAVSSGIDSSIDKNLFLGKEDEALEIISAYKNIYEDDFYLGLMVQSFKTENMSVFEIKKLATLTQTLTLPLSKTLYYKKEDKIVFEYIAKINNKTYDIEADEYFLKTKQELKEDFQMYPNVFANLDLFIHKINFTLCVDSKKLPKYKNNLSMTSHDYIEYLSKKGLERRLLGKQHIDYTTYLNRLQYELRTIQKMGYEDYFLIVYDFVNYAKKNKVLVGPGRGSAAGSLVSYCLGITDIDPVYHGLLFERFLNPERISMPDIDMDFPDDKRDDVIKYVQNKYGSDYVCNISTFGTFQIRSSIRDIARCMKIALKRVDEIVKLTQEFGHKELLEKFKDNQEIYHLLDIASRIEGLPRHISTHAAGIILSDVELTNMIPLQNGINGLYQSQLEAEDLEKLGMLKIDFLGIKNLTMINEMVEKIQKTREFKLNEINYYDEPTFRLLSRADTAGIFQLESAGIRRVLENLKPKCFEDVALVLGLYRPGPMEMIDEYIERRNGKNFSYLHPDLEKILKPTFGIIVYQEQIMLIAYEFAGYSLGEADLLRRAVSKKQEKILEEERTNFISKCIKRKYSKEVANQIYDYIVKFANYGFHRIHAISYGVISYQMAYLKANFLDVFMTSVLNNAIGNVKATSEYIRYCNANNIIVCGPDIMISTNEYIVFDNKIFMPIQTIMGVGNQIVKGIIELRSDGYDSYDEFKMKCDKYLNKRVLEGLIYSGCLDCFGHTKKYLIDNIEIDTSVFNKYLDDLIEDKTEYEEIFLAAKEKESLGFNLKYDIFKDITTMYQTTNFKKYSDTPIKRDVDVIGIILRSKVILDKNNKRMAFITIHDGQEELECIIFSNIYELVVEGLVKNQILIFQGEMVLRKDKKQLILNSINRLMK